MADWAGGKGDSAKIIGWHRFRRDSGHFQRCRDLWTDLNDSDHFLHVLLLCGVDAVSRDCERRKRMLRST